jgi:SAM-dependent methyltransferase
MTSRASAALPESSPYDPIAAFYDLEHADFDDDINMLRTIATIVGDPIIEFGCGTGRILRALAADGFDVTGVDDSQAMLANARHAADAVPSEGNIELAQADFRHPLPFADNTFGIGIFSLNGLMHLTTQQDQIGALAEAYRLLDPKGQLVIDLFNPTPEYLTQIASGPHFEGEWTSAEGAHVEKWTHRSIHSATQVIETRVWYDTLADNGKLTRTRTSFTLRYLHAAELELMLASAGFVDWKLYGSYELDPFDDASDRLIALAELSSAE